MLTLEAFRIHGPATLKGTLRISGAKNAALPAMTASILSSSTIRLTNLPPVQDVKTMASLLKGMGSKVDLEGETCILSSADTLTPEAPYDLVRTMRASILVLGPLLARFKHAKVSLPGGCAIGVRPVNMHLEGLERMGAEITIDHGYIEASAERLVPASYTFPKKTVTGTENLMMAASLIEGQTDLINCAEEPEVIFLARMLAEMGAKIEGAGTNHIVIHGIRTLSGGEFRIIPDRIEAGTYALMAAALPGSDLTLTHLESEHLESLKNILIEAGVPLNVTRAEWRIRGGSNLRAYDVVTAPYPGYPTDLQAQYIALMTQASGTCVVKETIFENRFQHVPELVRMGAKIKLQGSTATVIGPTPLNGAEVTASDLRASASLVLGGLAASGETTIRRIYHLDRGYTRMAHKLRDLGADVERIRVEHA